MPEEEQQQVDIAGEVDLDVEGSAAGHDASQGQQNDAVQDELNVIVLAPNEGKN